MWAALAAVPCMYDDVKHLPEVNMSHVAVLRPNTRKAAKAQRVTGRRGAGDRRPSTASQHVPRRCGAYSCQTNTTIASCRKTRVCLQLLRSHASGIGNLFLISA